MSGFIFKSTDQGLTWTESSTGLSQFSSTFNVVGLNDNLFTASADGVYRSTNAGISWSLAMNGMSSGAVYAIEVYGNTLLAGKGDGSFYKSTDDGNNWVNISDGLPPAGSTSAIEAIWLTGNNLLSGTYSTGVFWRPANEVITSISDDPAAQPFTFELQQNYPNPFNPVTNILFRLSNESHVKISVYNAIGEEIKVLLNENKAAGDYQLSFDGGNFSSGIYFYVMNAGEYTMTRKMVLNK
jgi:hypothetical protein